MNATTAGRGLACRAPCRGQHGIALVAVLWMLALLMLIAGGFAYSSRTASSLARNFEDATAARRLAETALYKTLLELANPDDATSSWTADGAEQTWSTPAGTVRIRVRNEAGLVNLNRAAPEVIGGLLRVAGLEEAERRDLADAIADWRDADSVRRPGGAEDDDYAAAGRAGGAKDAPFHDVSELHRVLGMSAGLFDRIEPFLTVHGRSGSVDRAAAPREVLLALPGADPAVVDRLLEERAARRESGSLATAAGSAEIVRISVTSELPSGARQRLRAIVRLRSARGTFSILSWRENA